MTIFGTDCLKEIFEDYRHAINFAFDNISCPKKWLWKYQFQDPTFV